MAFPVCPFCVSGVSWNLCGCAAARFAQVRGMPAARERYGVKGRVIKPRAATVVEPPAVLAAEAEKPWVAVFYAKPGDCVYCDARRAHSAAAMARSRAKRRGKRDE